MWHGERLVLPRRRCSVNTLQLYAPVPGAVLRSVVGSDGVAFAVARLFAEPIASRLGLSRLPTSSSGHKPHLESDRRSLSLRGVSMRGDRAPAMCATKRTKLTRCMAEGGSGLLSPISFLEGARGICTPTNILADQ